MLVHSPFATLGLCPPRHRRARASPSSGWPRVAVDPAPRPAPGPRRPPRLPTGWARSPACPGSSRSLTRRSSLAGLRPCAGRWPGRRARRCAGAVARRRGHRRAARRHAVPVEPRGPVRRVPARSLVPYDTAFHVGPHPRADPRLSAAGPRRVRASPSAITSGLDLVRAAALRWAGGRPLRLDQPLRRDAGRARPDPRPARDHPRRGRQRRSPSTLAGFIPLATDFSFLFAANPQAHWWADLLRGNLLLSLALVQPGRSPPWPWPSARWSRSPATTRGRRPRLARRWPRCWPARGAVLQGVPRRPPAPRPGVAALARAGARAPRRWPWPLPCALATALLVLGPGRQHRRRRRSPRWTSSTSPARASASPRSRGAALAGWAAAVARRVPGPAGPRPGRGRGAPCAAAPRPPSALAAMALAAWPLGLLFRVSRPRDAGGAEAGQRRRLPRRAGRAAAVGLHRRGPGRAGPATARAARDRGRAWPPLLALPATVQFAWKKAAPALRSRPRADGARHARAGRGQPARRRRAAAARRALSPAARGPDRPPRPLRAVHAVAHAVRAARTRSSAATRRSSASSAPRDRAEALAIARALGARFVASTAPTACASTPRARSSPSTRSPARVLRVVPRRAEMRRNSSGRSVDEHDVRVQHRLEGEARRGRPKPRGHGQRHEAAPHRPARACAPAAARPGKPAATSARSSARPWRRASQPFRRRPSPRAVGEQVRHRRRWRAPGPISSQATASAIANGPLTVRRSATRWPPVPSASPRSRASART